MSRRSARRRPLASSAPAPAPAAQPAVPPARPVALPAVDVPSLDVAGAAPDPLEQLGVLADELAALDESRRALLTSRDALVRAERSRGITWDVLAAACRTSPQALMKRHAGSSDDGRRQPG